MKGITVAVLGDGALAAALGKKGTVSDLSFFNLKRGDVGVTYVHPSRYPERIQPLLNCLAMADAVVLVVGQLDRAFGEQVVAIDSLGIRRGHIVLRNYIGPEQLRAFVAGTALEDFRWLDPDPVLVNELFATSELLPVGGPVRVPVDHFFNVKGVGTVVLGCVRRGTVRVHDALEAFPTGKRVLVKSIQVHDEDVPEAPFGVRVGLALRGIDASELDRGVVLAPPGTLKVPEALEMDLQLNKYWKGTLRKDMQLHASSGLQVVPVRMEDAPAEGIRPGTRGRAVLRPQRPLACDPGERLVLLDLDARGLRVAGFGVLG